MGTDPLWRLFELRPKGRPIVLYFNSLNRVEQQEWRDRVRDVATARRSLADARKDFGLPRGLNVASFELQCGRLRIFRQRLLSKYRCDELRGFPLP